MVAECSHRDAAMSLVRRWPGTDKVWYGLAWTVTGGLSGHHYHLRQAATAMTVDDTVLLFSHQSPIIEGSAVKSVPTNTELARPFLPTRDFARSRDFYLAIGFDLLLDSEVAIFAAGSGGFILQRHFDEGWAANCMMQLMVDDLDAWWAHLQGLDLPRRFGVTPPKAPAVQPWGLRVAYLIDPAGVLWHVAERRPGVAHDVGLRA